MQITAQDEAREKSALTPMKQREEQVLIFLRKYFEKHEFSPTYQEVADEIGITQPYVSVIMQRLAKRGCISKEGRQRSIKLLAA